MRILFAAGALALIATVSGSGNAHAARWCSGSLEACFGSYRACVRAAGGDCHRVADQPRPSAGAWRTEFPSRPAYASPYTCYFDEGYGRYRPCDAGGGPP